MRIFFIPSLLIGILLFESCTTGKNEQNQPGRAKSDTATDAVLDGVTRVEKARAALDDAKITLVKEGKYACCIKDGCDYCALHEASCSCYEDLKAGRHVCTECYSGWQQGKGMDPEIKKENVTTSFVGHEHSH